MDWNFEPADAKTPLPQCLDNCWSLLAPVEYHLAPGITRVQYPARLGVRGDTPGTLFITPTPAFTSRGVLLAAYTWNDATRPFELVYHNLTGDTVTVAAGAPLAFLQLLPLFPSTAPYIVK
jgi:hypothetical protein